MLVVHDYWLEYLVINGVLLMGVIKGELHPKPNKLPSQNYCFEKLYKYPKAKCQRS